MICTDALSVRHSIQFRILISIYFFQTVDKVSFCAPDREFERGFSYICRDGASQRWMCHSFMAKKDSVTIHCNFGLILLSACLRPKFDFQAKICQFLGKIYLLFACFSPICLDIHLELKLFTLQVAINLSLTYSSLNM